MVLTLQKADSAKIISVPMDERPIDDSLAKEWLLTNERGGYASSTIVGCNTRRYHGLLIGSVNPLASRIMAFANCLEMVIFDGRVFNLSTFEFNGKFAPQGFKYIKQFSRDTGVHFDYRLDKLELTKSVYLLRNIDMVALVYDFTNIEKPAEFVLRPFIGLRDFHALQKSYAPLCSTWVEDGLSIRHNAPDSCELFLKCPSMNFRKDRQWWFNFVYRLVFLSAVWIRRSKLFFGQISATTASRSWRQARYRPISLNNRKRPRHPPTSRRFVRICINTKAELLLVRKPETKNSERFV
jgi:hypothetical protein